ncbi:hypothetical protein VPH209E381_0033 [Vibrio phage 209E38-1]
MWSGVYYQNAYIAFRCCIICIVVDFAWLI